jgi:hypothetical protein
MPHGVLSLRQLGTAGRSVRMTTYRSLPTGFAVDGDQITVGTRRGEHDHVWQHRRVAAGWQVTDASSRPGAVLLGGRRLAAPAPLPTERPVVLAVPAVHLAWSSSVLMRLGDAHYRPTEVSWDEAGRPQAEVRICHGLPALAPLIVSAVVTLARAPVFAPATASNPLDNELADVNSDGVQLHWRSPASGAWNSVVAVPDADAVRLTAAEGALDGLTATWSRTEVGYDVTFTLPWPASWPELVLDVIVNERPPERERRRGQLVLSGAHGEFAYLRGARQSAARALHVVFDPAQP